MPKRGFIREDVERYESGRIKYVRDGKAEYEANKGKRTLISVKVEPDTANQFEARLETEGTTKNAKIKGWISAYLDGKLE